MTNKKPLKLQRKCHTFATFFATCNAYNNKQDGGRAKSPTSCERWALIGPFWQKLRCELLRGCYTQATCLATLRKVEGRSTFLATRNATIAVAKWDVTREFFLATCNATFVPLQVARKIASCNMALLCPVEAVSISDKVDFKLGKACCHKIFLVRKKNSHEQGVTFCISA